MNDLDYLNQISAGVQNQAQKPTFLDKKMKIIIGILGGAILLLIILVAAVGSSPKETEATATSELGRLYTRVEELTKTITKYNGSVSKPSLRSTGASFSTLLAELSTTTKSYLTNYGIELNAITPSASDTTLITNLNSSLENYRLNGILDRKYASEMYFQIRYLIVIEDSVREKTTDTNLQTYLESSKTSLSRLQETFYNFSESD